jgi:hypothetical protein
MAGAAALSRALSVSYFCGVPPFRAYAALE